MRRRTGWGIVAMLSVFAVNNEITVNETEPNHVPALANVVALGTRVTGIIDPFGDVDVYALDLTAGTFLSIDVDAESIGSPLDPIVGLISPDGTTTLALNDDFDGADSRISFRITANGRYYVGIRSFGNEGNPAFAYAIHFGTVTCAGAGTEREPNGTAAGATPLDGAGSGSGELCALDQNPAGDVDTWSFQAQAGTTVELDVDSHGGVGVDAFLALFASNGTTQLAANEDADGKDPRLQFTIPTTGTYYAAVSSRTRPGGNPFLYSLSVRTVLAGPGDPIGPFARNLNSPFGITVGSRGDVFVGEFTTNRVVRITSDGTVTPFLTGIPSPLGLAVDATDRLLVVSSDGTVYRMTAPNTVTPFITDAVAPFWIAVAPDGKIWLTNTADRSLRRYSAAGVFEASFDGTVIGQSGPISLTIGPAGEPFVSNGTEIWKLTGGQFRRVLAGGTLLRGFAFDVAGNIYAAAPGAGRVIRFDPIGQVQSDPFAIGADTPVAVAFARDVTGITVARLFVVEPILGTVIEVNQDGLPHRGLPAGVTPQPFTADAAAQVLLGAGTFTDEELLFLDAVGNHNGRYDVGDLAAYLAFPGVEQ